MLKHDRPHNTWLRTAQAASAAVLVPVLLGVTVLPAAAASTVKGAWTATVSASSCAASGGSFTQTAGNRTCTRKATSVVEAAPVSREKSLITNTWPGGSARVSLVGTSYTRTTVETTTVRVQSGSKPVRETTSSRTSSVTVPVTCVERTVEERSGFSDPATGTWVEGTSSRIDTDMPVTRCELEGLFTG